MNGEVFNELVDILGAVQTTFRSLETFPLKTRTLFETVLRVLSRLKAEQPPLNQEERDTVFDLEERLRAYQTNAVLNSRNLVEARQAFRDTALMPFLNLLDETCIENPKYGVWLRSLAGYKLLRKLVGV